MLAAAPLAAMGSFLPTPTWYQYFYTPLPFALLAIAAGLARPPQRPAKREGIKTLTTALRSEGTVQRAPRLASARRDLSPADALKVVLASLDEAKAEDLVSIDITGKTAASPTTWSWPPAARTGTSAAIADRLIDDLKEAGGRDIRVEGLRTADWVLVDAGDVIVHIFRPEVRAFYNIEKMWRADHPAAPVASRPDRRFSPDEPLGPWRAASFVRARSDGEKAVKVTVVAVGRLKAGPERELARPLSRPRRAAPDASSASPSTSARSPKARAERRHAARTRRPPRSSRAVPAGRDRSSPSTSAAKPSTAAASPTASPMARRRDARTLSFAIGGADGLGPAVLDRADLRLAFGAMTWPHQLVRIMLAEQLYRAVTILSGHPYHRD